MHCNNNYISNFYFILGNHSRKQTQSRTRCHSTYQLPKKCFYCFSKSVITPIGKLTCFSSITCTTLKFFSEILTKFTFISSYLPKYLINQTTFHISECQETRSLFLAYHRSRRHKSLAVERLNYF